MNNTHGSGFLASSLGYCYYFCVYLRQLMNDPLSPYAGHSRPSPLAYAVFLPTNSLDECWITVSGRGAVVGHPL